MAIDKTKTLSGDRHIILVSDGLSNSGHKNDAAIQALVEDAHARGVQLSTVALGMQADSALLKKISELGGGRFYDVVDIDALSTTIVDDMRKMNRVVPQAPPSK